MSKSPTVRACWLGSAPYRAVWDLQAELVAAVRDGSATDTVLLLEHPHVFTLGKAGGANDLLWDEEERVRREVYVMLSDRGGEATYHAPSQLLGYPILHLTILYFTMPVYLVKLVRSPIA